MLRGNRFGKDEGFTLIEMMIVVLIIAILIAIAIPTFLGARRRSQDAQAKSHVRAGLVTQKTYYADHFAYTDSNAVLEDIESNLQWGDPDATVRGVVVDDLSANGEGVVLRSLSKSGVLFCIADLASPFDYGPEGYPITSAGTWFARKDDALGGSDCRGLVWEPSSAGWA